MGAGAGVPCVEDDLEDEVPPTAGLLAEAEADGDDAADAALTRPLAPTFLVLVVLPSSTRHLSSRGSPVDGEAVVCAVLEPSSRSTLLPLSIRFVDLSKPRYDLDLLHFREPLDT